VKKAEIGKKGPNKPYWIVFVDFDKAFDRVDRLKLV